MSNTAKVIELVGNSNESWEHAAQSALNDADETLEEISGIKIVSQTATVEDGQIDQYKTVLHVSFQLKR
ncbi:dodecin family protein [Halobaculum roseum]|uniref:Dodecin family protein n=1 Tax=Halobaculum roseum TaxID=2175149 RepID=A0ABD5MNN4_9EURY|nr:dodecin family protein [Halobaculum roseum]QZY03459.1 dodecin family protein [Halobaculum roseum]